MRYTCNFDNSELIHPITESLMEVISGIPENPDIKFLEVRQRHIKAFIDNSNGYFEILDFKVIPAETSGYDFILYLHSNVTGPMCTYKHFGTDNLYELIRGILSGSDDICDRFGYKSELLKKVED